MSKIAKTLKTRALNMYRLLQGIMVIWSGFLVQRFLIHLNPQSIISEHICPLPLTQPEHSNVCFWYIPPSLRGLTPGPARDARLHQVSTEHQWFLWTPSVMVRKMGEMNLKETDRAEKSGSYSSCLCRWLLGSKAG